MKERKFCFFHPNLNEKQINDKLMMSCQSETIIENPKTLDSKGAVLSKYIGNCFGIVRRTNARIFVCISVNRKNKMFKTKILCNTHLNETVMLIG